MPGTGEIVTGMATQSVIPVTPSQDRVIYNSRFA
jgi:hypothetical protein